MSLLVPKLKGGSGGGWETKWFCTTKNNWVYKVIYDSDKNEMKIWIVHNTDTHVGVPDYIGDEKCSYITSYEKTYPIFKCPICKRKSTGTNCKEMFDLFLDWYLNKAQELNADVLINANKDEIIKDFLKDGD